MSSFPPGSKSSLLATVILYMYQDSFHTPISLQEFIFDFKQNFTLPDVERYDEVLKHLGIAEILKYMQALNSIELIEDVLGYELQYFVKSKNQSILRNLLNKYSHCLIDEDLGSFDSYFENFGKKFCHLAQKQIHEK